MSGIDGAGHMSFAGADHDHGSCVVEALDRAARLCARRGARLTALRRRVLELVWRSHAPQGAYAVLEALGRDVGRGGRPAAPPTVYRALDFLLANGLIHRVESLNAFVGCPTPGEPHAAQFFICGGCGDTAEFGDERIGDVVRERAEALGFAVGRETIEVSGLCPACRDTPGGAP